MRLCLKIISSGIILTFLSSRASAQVVLDGTFSGTGPLNGPAYEILGSFGEIRGSNLFHSFREFNVFPGESATFSGPGTISNIISRVTGSNVSTLNGLIKSTIDSANFFLINPNGLILGESLQLDISGAFSVSTGNYVKLGDSGILHATNPQDSILTSAPPSAFGFLPGTPAPVTINEATLSTNNSPLRVVGGDLMITNGTIQVTNSNLALIGSGGNSEVPLDPNDLATHLDNLDGSIRISGSTSIDVGSGGNSSIYIRAGKIVMDDVVIAGTTVNSEGAGKISIFAKDLVELEDSVLRTESSGAGAGGNITISAGEIRITRGAAVRTSATGTGDGGNITLAGESISVSGHGSNFLTGVITETLGDLSAGTGGTITIDSNSLEVTSEGVILSSTSGDGTGGSVNINTPVLSLSGDLAQGSTGIFTITTDTVGGGDSGDIQVSATDLSILSGAAIQAASFGDGIGGDIKITASSIVISRNESMVPTGVFTQLQSSLTGSEAGRIEITTESLKLTAGGTIDASTFGIGPAGNIRITAGSISIARNGSGFVTGILSNTLAETNGGPAGRIVIDSSAVSLDSRGIIATTSNGSGLAGIIEINVTDFAIRNNAEIDSSGLDTGDSGSISINASRAIDIEGGRLSTAADLSRGGNISIRAGDLTKLINAQIDASGASAGGRVTLDLGNTGLLLRTRIRSDAIGDAGDISVTARLAVIAGSELIANSAFGQGGSITINTEDSIISEDTVISSTAFIGEVGTVEINKPENVLATELVPLTRTFIDREAQLYDSCAVKVNKALSSFSVGKRTGTPIHPGTLIPVFSVIDDGEDNQRR